MDDTSAQLPPINLLQSFGETLSLIVPFVRGSLVYVDSGIAEALGRIATYSQLVGLGAVHVCHLEGACSHDASTAARLNNGATVPGLVVCTTQPLPRVHDQLINLLKAHEAAGIMGTRAYTDYARILIQDATSAGVPSAPQPHVAYWPLHPVVLDTGSFVLPAASAAAQTSGAPLGYGSVSFSSADDDEEETPASPADPGPTVLAHCLVGLMAQCGLRCEAYALGPSSVAVAQEIATAAVPAAATDAPTRPASLILVDRAADLWTPLLPHDSLLAAVAERMPRAGVPGKGTLWPTADISVAVPSANECVNKQRGGGGGSQGTHPKHPFRSGTAQSTKAAVQGDVHGRAVDADAQGHADAPEAPSTPRRGPLVSGPRVCHVHLIDARDPKGAQWWEFLVPRQGKDGPLFVRKWLREALRQASLQPAMRSKPGAVEPEELTTLAGQLQGEARGTAVVPLAHAAAAMLRSDATTAPFTEQLHAIAHAPSIAAVDAGLQQLLTRATQVMAAGSASPQDVVKLALRSVMVASAMERERAAAGQDGQLDEETMTCLLQGVLVAANVQSPALDCLSDMLRTLRTAVATRSACRELHTLYDTHNSVCTSLASRLGALLAAMRPLPDLKHCAGSIGGLLRSGLGRFGLHSQPVAGEHGLVVVFVVGGVSVQEIADLRAAHPEVQLLVGGTTLLRSADVVRAMAPPVLRAWLDE